MSDTPEASGHAPAKPTSPWFRLAWAAWLAAFVLTLVVIAATLTKEMQDTMPAYTVTTCASTECDPFTFTAEDGAFVVNELGWPRGAVQALARTIAIVSSLAATVIVFVGVFLVWRRPRDGMVLLVVLAMVGGNGVAFSPVGSRLGLVWAIPVDVVSFAGVTALGVLLFVFPAGGFFPRWTRWPVIIVVGGFMSYVGLSLLYPDHPWLNDDVVLVTAFLALVMVPGAVSQVLRYLRVSTAAERQQTKWVVWALLLMIPGMAFWIVAGSLYPLGDLSAGRIAVQTVMHFFINPVVGILLPLAFAVAVIRYRLWDADLVIQRTLVYAALTAVLVGGYLGSIVGLQALFRAATGQESNVAIVVSTLLIAALFQPLRRRIQTAVDRRLYRSKYDAARTLAAFGARVRDEVDLGALTGELTAVVEQTMRPAHVSLWLRRTPQRERA